MATTQAQDHSCELDISKIQGDSGKTYDKDNRSQNEVSLDSC